MYYKYCPACHEISLVQNSTWNKTSNMLWFAVFVAFSVLSLPNSVHVTPHTEQKSWTQNQQLLCVIVLSQLGLSEQRIHTATLTLCEIWGYLQWLPRASFTIPAFKSREAENREKERGGADRKAGDIVGMQMLSVKSSWVKWICSAVMILLTLVPFKT